MRILFTSTEIGIWSGFKTPSNLWGVFLRFLGVLGGNPVLWGICWQHDVRWRLFGSLLICTVGPCKSCTRFFTYFSLVQHSEFCKLYFEYSCRKYVCPIVRTINHLPVQIAAEKTWFLLRRKFETCSEGCATLRRHIEEPLLQFL